MEEVNNLDYKNSIPEIINGFNLYQGIETDDKKLGNNEKFLGVTGEVQLPDLVAMTETISGSGILGELEVANPGHFSNIDMEIPFVSFCGDMLKFSMTETTNLTLRMAHQSVVKSTRNLCVSELKIVLGGMVKSMKLGTVKMGGQLGSSVTLSVNYILISRGNSKLFELDKINEVYLVNGVDQLAKIRECC